tara:strand:- start:710 stop:916 length:207 start_codon:yes stop_codon:yes gene_type:complete
MKDDMVHLRVDGNLIYVICHNEKQQQKVIKNMTEPGKCVFEGYEVWEEDTVILTFRVLDYEDLRPPKN